MEQEYLVLVLFKRLSFIFFVIVLAQPILARAQTFEAELARVAKLRKTFGDEFVSGLTNLPPAKYPAARNQALALADQVTSGSLAREEARTELCASFAKDGGNGCPALSPESAEAEEETIVSAVQKDQPAQQEPPTQQEQVRMDSGMEAEDAAEPQLESSDETPVDAKQASVPQLRRPPEPELESDPPDEDQPSREVSSESKGSDEDPRS